MLVTAVALPRCGEERIPIIDLHYSSNSINTLRVSFFAALNARLLKASAVGGK